MQEYCQVAQGGTVQPNCLDHRLGISCQGKRMLVLKDLAAVTLSSGPCGHSADGSPAPSSGILQLYVFCHRRELGGGVSLGKEPNKYKF